MSIPPLNYDRILYFKSSRHRRYEQSYTSDTRQYLCWCLILYETRSGLSERPERSGRSHCLETHKRERSCLVYLVRPEFQCTRLYSYLWMLIGLPSPPHGFQDSRSLQTETNWHLQALATRSCGRVCILWPREPAGRRHETIARVCTVVYLWSGCRKNGRTHETLLSWYPRGYKLIARAEESSTPLTLTRKKGLDTVY